MDGAEAYRNFCELGRGKSRVPSQLGKGWRAAELKFQFLAGFLQAKRLFLEASADFDETVISQKAAQLTENKGNGIGGKAGLIAQIEAVDGFDQANGTNLKQILGIYAPATEAADHRPHQPGILSDQ